MKIHIFISEFLYTYTYLKFLERNFDISSNLFVFKKSSEKKFDYGENLSGRIVYAENNIKFFLLLYRDLKKSSKIIFHQLPYGPALIIWNLFPRLILKTTWIIWGGDLYLYKNKNENIISLSYEFLRIKIIRHIPQIAALIPGDFEVASQIYRTKAIYQPVFYPFPLDFLNYSKSQSANPNKKTRILVGNSGNPSNNHLEILTKFVQIKDTDIQIICPLSYSGDSVYINSVVEMGKELFGDKFVPLLNYIEPEEYTDLLWNIDIAIMNHDRQQGIGHIVPLLYFKKKVYVRSTTTSYEYFKDIGCQLYDILSIGNFYESDLRIDAAKLTTNHLIIGKLFSEKACKALWDKILN